MGTLLRETSPDQNGSPLAKQAKTAILMAGSKGHMPGVPGKADRRSRMGATPHPTQN